MARHGDPWLERLADEKHRSLQGAGARRLGGDLSRVDIAAAAAHDTAADHRNACRIGGGADLSRLLAQSATDRSAIVDAIDDVNACGSNLAGGAQACQQTAASRENLLSQLTALPASYALPAPMLQDLSGAW